MTITYPDGTAVKALLLSRREDTLSIVASGDDDVRTFTLVSDTWISERHEPVKIEFAWQRGNAAGVPSETECVCSKELASRLMSMLFTGIDGDDLIRNTLYVFSPEGHRVRIKGSQLNIWQVPAEIDSNCRIATASSD